MIKSTRMLAVIIILMVAVAGCGSSSSDTKSSSQPNGIWVAGDFHNHTFLTDGSHTEADVVSHAFGPLGNLDWMANSEHGGAFNRDPYGNPWDPSIILGDASQPGYMWRWQSLRDFSSPILFDAVSGLQAKFPTKVLVQAVEWNVPTHEHASVGIVEQTDGRAISNFEYMCDQSDKDTSRSGEGLVKQNATHADAVACASYLENNYKDISYYLINHPSRKQLFTVADIRDFNNAAPDVAFGMEGLPGHQKESSRGGYGSTFKNGDGSTDAAKTARARTYGGADYMVAKVGGLWDSLLGEGRKFWVFVNSDFHSSAPNADFYPGEYAKSYTFVTEKTAKAIVAGMRSGNSFAVHGDLIGALDFQAGGATMGGEATVANGSDLTVTIRFKSPSTNNYGDRPIVDHIDLIAGDVTGLIPPSNPNYQNETNPSAKVIKSFTSRDWTTDSEGYLKIVYTISKVQKNQYLRLRGTNLGFNAPNQTDSEGNPLNDDLMGSNDQAKAYADLWFYSNPVFIRVK